jgi:hypothetical protein
MNKLLIITSLIALVVLSFADSLTRESSNDNQTVAKKRKSSPPNDDGPTSPNPIRPPKRVG